MQVQPYLFFEGRCEEALQFYGKVLGIKVDMLMRYKEAPEPAESAESSAAGDCALPPGSEEKVMHASFKLGDTTVMCSDGRCSGQPRFEGFSLSLNPTDDAHAKTLFDALAEGGSIQMPLTKTFFASSFGMVADRFGVSWMVVVEPERGA
jgi:PhnB protein